MPAAKSMAPQVNRPNLGWEWSGPIFVVPVLRKATTRTKTTTTPAVRT